MAKTTKAAAKKTTAKAATKAVKEVKEVKEEVKAPAAEVKATAPKAETKAAAKAETKAAPKAETKAAPKAEVKAEPAKAAPAKKPGPKAKKAETKVEVAIQYAGGQEAVDAIVENVKKVLEGNGVKDVKDLKIFVKPEDRKAYYVADGVEGDMDVNF